MNKNLFVQDQEEEPPGEVPHDSEEEQPPGNSTIKSDDEQPPDHAIRFLKSSYAPQPPLNLTFDRIQALHESDLFKSTPDDTYFLQPADYRGVERSLWNDWHWQTTHRIRTAEELSRYIDLSESENKAINSDDKTIAFSITPYYLDVIAAAGRGSVLRKTVIPTLQELERDTTDRDDPLGEHSQTITECLVHRYPDRVLFLATDFCSTYCRYCTRSRIVGKKELSRSCRHKQWEAALDYIRATPAIRDVLISGGDPLTLPDSELFRLLTSVRSIPHVEIIRIGTKVPAVLPMRITAKLISILKKFHPLYLSLHFTHPDELTPETEEACGKLADAGIPLGSQTVLLKGINDDADTLKKLFHGLLRMRVRPYYLYQCDPVAGAGHFRTTVRKGLELIDALRGHTTGYAVPQFVVDAPGGGGKIPLISDHIRGRDGEDLLLSNYEGKMYRYPDTDGTLTSSKIRQETE